MLAGTKRLQLDNIIYSREGFPLSHSRDHDVWKIFFSLLFVRRRGVSASAFAFCVFKRIFHEWKNIVE
jgi:hypothetical protein